MREILPAHIADAARWLELAREEVDPLRRIGQLACAQECLAAALDGARFLVVLPPLVPDADRR